MRCLGLSDIEYELMTFFWREDKPVIFAEVLKYCNEEKGRKWANTTAHTHLTRMVEKGLVRISHPGTKRCYSAAISQEALAAKVARETVNSSYNGSLKEFVNSFAGGKENLTEEEKLELKELLTQLLEEKPE